MLVSECRKRLMARAERGDNSITPYDQDIALQSALHRMQLSAHYATKTLATVPMTQGDPEVSVSSIANSGDDLRPEDVVRVELAYSDQGAWADSTAYVKRDLVKDNNKFYVCTVAHTSATATNKPSVTNNAVWERRMHKRGDRIDVLDHDSIMRMLGDTLEYNYHVVYEYLLNNEDGDTSGQPRAGGWRDEYTFVTYPPPDQAYLISFMVKRPVTDWEPGVKTADNIYIDVPKKILLPMIDFGALYYADTSRSDHAFLLTEFERHVDRVRGTIVVDDGEGVKDEAAFQGPEDSVFSHSDRGYWR